MTFEEYERFGQGDYAGLSETVAAILRAATARADGLHAQQIQHRAKDAASLRRKLARAGAETQAQIEPIAKDLAGTRLVFYTNADVDRFQQSRILQDNFDIDWDRTRFHHPTSDDAQASELFISANYVVRLKPERAELPEYARYAGLWCEVQVQTTLNHAWAEMAHDTIYKTPELQGFGRQLMDGIEARMKTIMRDHLAPAGYAFDLVLRDFQRLSRGQSLFERDLSASIDAAEDNNAIYEILQTFKTSVLPHVDDYDAVSSDILSNMIKAVGRARALPLRARSTPFGDLDGHSAIDVIKVAAAVIRDLRFMDVAATFGLLCDLFLGATSDEDRACWVKQASALAEHNLRVWEQAGPSVPVLLMGAIQALPETRKTALKPVLMEVARHVLAVELSGTTSGLDTITVHRGAVTPSDALRTARGQAIDLLVAFDVMSTDVDRPELISALRRGMVLPSPSRTVPNALTVMVCEDAARIVRHFTSCISDWSYELRQSVEHDLLWTYRQQASGSAHPGREFPPDVQAAREDLAAAILEFRDAVNQDAGFTTYKLLVGFESVFAPAWLDPEFDHTDEEAYRQAEIEILVAGINASNADGWLAIVRRCVATESNDLATFPTFAHFVERLGATRPEIVLGWLPRFDARLAGFLTPFLRGLRTTELWPDAVALLKAWRVEGRFLPSLAWVAGSVDSLDLAFLEDVLDAAIAAGDLDAILNIITAVGMRDGPGTGARLKPTFLKAVKAASKAGEARWVRVWRFRQDRSSLLQRLTAREATRVLNTLVGYKRVDSALERVLVPLAERHPQRVIDYFGQRIATHFERDYGRDYQDIPYDLHGLAKALAPAGPQLVRTARIWFGAEPGLFSYHGGKLIEAVYPTFDKALREELTGFLKRDDPDGAKFVIQVMSAYAGQKFLQPLARDVVASLPLNDPLLDVLEGALEPTGVTSGEFGRVTRLIAHRAAILEWMDDDREPVQAFARRYAHQLENSIRIERRRSEESVAVRRLEWEALGIEPTAPRGRADAGEAAPFADSADGD